MHDISEITFTGPSERLTDVFSIMASLGFYPSSDTIISKIIAIPRTNHEKGETLRRLRIDKELTQSQLSQSSGIAQRHLSEIETGKRPIGKDLAHRLAKSLQVDYRILL
jgi:DNA-binding XRE family transcriptional regulator